jgi:hypothetical protein
VNDLDRALAIAVLQDLARDEADWDVLLAELDLIRWDLEMSQ